MPNSQKSGDRPDSTRTIAGLPIVRAQVAGMDIGSERHRVCAPGLEGSGREVADFGATTAELVRMAEWLKERKIAPCTFCLRISNINRVIYSAHDMNSGPTWTVLPSTSPRFLR